MREIQKEPIMRFQPNFAVVLFSLIAVASIGANRPTPLARDPFKGKWEVTITPDDDARLNGAKEFKDTLTFTPTMFSSDQMQKKGFDPVQYDDDTRPGSIGGFDANQTSKTDGKLKWSGFVTADQFEGNLVWTKTDGTVLNYAVKGSKK
jgi:hypothetical protein